MKDFKKNAKESVQVKTWDFNEIQYKNLHIWNSLQKMKYQCITTREYYKEYINLSPLQTLLKKRNTSQENSKKKETLET
jgi:hypothetical protein